MVEHWSIIPKVAGSIPTVVRQTFQPAQCGCTLRVTPQTYSPEYTTPTHTKSKRLIFGIINRQLRVIFQNIVIIISQHADAFRKVANCIT